MTTFLLEFRNIFVFIICSFGLAIILLAAVYILSFTSKIGLEKSSAYECDFQPFLETSYPFEVQFAVIAIMFLLFDIEVLYLFPLIQSLYSLYTIDIAIIIGLLYKISIITIFTANAFIFLLCNSKVLFKNQQKKIQATDTYEKFQALKKTHDF